MIKHIDFLPSKLDLSSEDEDEAQRYALYYFMDVVTTKMHKKLLQKHYEGYHGWDNPDMKGHILESLEKHVERAKDDPDQWIDVMNLAAMLWNFEP